ncbi:TPA: hypothetical protein ACGA21_001474 [Acinetobacter baumannii]
MGLFEEIRKKSDEYISIDFAVECLALREGSLYKAVMVLLHYKVDEATPCYMQDEYFNFTDIDNDNDEPSEYSAFEILTDIKKEAESNGGIESKVINISDSLKSKISKYYWEKDLLLSVMPIEKSFEFKVVDLANSREITPPYINKTVSSLVNHDYKFYLFKKPLLTFHEAACIMTGYDPQYVDQCQNDTNFKQNFSNYLGAYDYISTCIDAQMLSYDSYSNRLYASEFKQFLANVGHFVDGFNDGLDEPKSNIMDSDLNTQKIISNLELDLAIEKNKVEKLNEEIDNLKAHIAELESKKMQYPQKENAINDDKINIANSDLLLIAALMTTLRSEIKVKGKNSQAKVLQRIEDEHGSIKGLSKSRTEKVLASANSLYKSLINNEMK